MADINKMQIFGAMLSDVGSALRGKQGKMLPLYMQQQAEDKEEERNRMIQLGMLKQLGMLPEGATPEGMEKFTSQTPIAPAPEKLQQYGSQQISGIPSLRGSEGKNLSGFPQTQFQFKSNLVEQTPKSEAEQKLAVEGAKKWTTEEAERQIKFDVLTPKLANYMEVGGRAYQELKDTAKRYGVNLNYETGGLNAIIANASKNIAMKAKLAPLMVALERLRPELGTELMRQLGAFRSASMAKRFADTLAQFSGDIREDIANMSSTITKNKANVVLLGEDGKPLPNKKRNEKMDEFEANLIRKYNLMYRGMGLMSKPYTAQRSFKWLAKNSEFNEKENSIINQAVKQNPKAKKIDIIAKLIERGLL